jgi:hypothetical protein
VLKEGYEELLPIVMRHVANGYDGVPSLTGKAKLNTATRSRRSQFQ